MSLDWIVTIHMRVGRIAVLLIAGIVNSLMVFGSQSTINSNHTVSTTFPVVSRLSSAR